MRRAILSSLVLFACAESSDPGPVAPPPAPAGPSEPASVSEARGLYPKLIDLQVKVIAHTCSPNPGVCHNGNNYPDMRTPGSLLAAVEAPCNVEMPDPTQGWDACERQADWLIAGDFRSEIAWMESVGPGHKRLGLRTAPMVGGTRRPQIYAGDREVVFEPVEDWNATVELVAGRAEVDLRIAPAQPFILELVDAALGAVVGGDPNRNGVFGAELTDRGALVTPKDPTKSYLWGRITGTVPGTRMPLANEPLTNAAYAAIACWIEGLDPSKPISADDPIDYDACNYAKTPLDPAILP
jgi:hypothetical protein